MHRPIPYMNIDRIAPAGHTACFIIAEGSAPGAVHSFTMSLQPVTCLAQTCHMIRRHGSVWHGTYVHQQIPIPGSTLQQSLQQLSAGHRFSRHIAPGVVQCEAAFPADIRVVCPHTALRRLIIPQSSRAVAVIGDNIRLQGADHTVHVFLMPEVRNLYAAVQRAGSFLPQVQVSPMTEPVILATIKP